jgi:hypothetical protein
VGVWLRTDETEESVSALAMLKDSLVKVNEDVYQWKWAVIAAHNALQGFMVLALRNGNNLAIMSEKAAGKWLEAYREEKPLPEERLDSFHNLYKKIQGEYMLTLVTAKKLNATPEQSRSTKKLNELRNEFIHFVPKGWSLEVSGLPEICLHVMEIIKFLGWESNNILWYKPALRTKAELLISEINMALKEIESIYQKSS